MASPAVWVGFVAFKVPIVASLGVIAGILVSSVIASWLWAPRDPSATPSTPAP